MKKQIYATILILLICTTVTGCGQHFDINIDKDTYEGKTYYTEEEANYICQDPHYSQFYDYYTISENNKCDYSYKGINYAYADTGSFDYEYCRPEGIVKTDRDYNIYLYDGTSGMYWDWALPTETEDGYRIGDTYKDTPFTLDFINADVNVGKRKIVYTNGTVTSKGIVHFEAGEQPRALIVFDKKVLKGREINLNIIGYILAGSEPIKGKKTVGLNVDSCRLYIRTNGVIKSLTVNGEEQPRLQYYFDKVGTYKIRVELLSGTVKNATVIVKDVYLSTPDVSDSAHRGSFLDVLATTEFIEADGFKIVYSTNKNFKNAKTKIVTGKSGVKSNHCLEYIRGISPQKTYYVKVKSFAYDSHKKKVWSKYSKVVKLDPIE